MEKFRLKIILIFFSVLILAYFFYIIIKKPDSHILDIPSDKEMIACNEWVEFNFNPFTTSPKVVTFLKPDKRVIYELKKWIPYIKKYPEMPFIFYFTQNNKNEIVSGLKEIDFPIPVFIDTNEKNPYFNMLLICFIIDENNNIIELSNPTIPSFEQSIKSCLQTKRR